MPRIGFACQYRHARRDLPATELKVIEGTFNPRTTTLRWLNSVSPQVGRDKLLEIVRHNLDAQVRLLAYVAELPPTLRMLRLSSDLLPFYSHPDGGAFYRDPAIVDELATRFAAIGAQARAADIRLSFHPGQYCVLGSDRPEVVENSLAEFEYHADMIRWMGYGRRFQDFKCNLYAHSDQMWNRPTNAYARQFLERFDIMIEAKHKNIAAQVFYLACGAP